MTIEAFHRLLQVLALQRVDEDRFVGCSGGDADAPWNLYGGHLLGQTLAAACATVPTERPVHSLHAYFLRPGDNVEPIEYVVTRTRDGRAYSNRRVVAHQKGKAIFEMAASFQVPEEGREFGQPPPAGVAGPDDLPSLPELVAARDELPFDTYWSTLARPVDLRYVHAPWSPHGPSEDQGISAWWKTFGPLPDDPHVHACVAAYQADESISDNTLVPHGVTWTDDGLEVASLDHSMWFHRPFRADDWLLTSQEPIATSGGRGLALGRIWDRQGRLVATMTQEVLIRI